METTYLTTENTNLINSIIAKYYFVKDRERELHKLGFKIEKLPMGSGGVGQVKHLQKESRLQIGYGVTRHNYASCVIFKNK